MVENRGQFQRFMQRASSSNKIELITILKQMSIEVKREQKSDVLYAGSCALFSVATLAVDYIYVSGIYASAAIGLSASLHYNKRRLQQIQECIKALNSNIKETNKKH